MVHMYASGEPFYAKAIKTWNQITPENDIYKIYVTMLSDKELELLVNMGRQYIL